MARSLCGVPELIHGSSAHSSTGSETTEDQRSKQVTVASCTTPLEHYEGIYSMPYDNLQSPTNQVMEDEYEDNNGSKKITRSCRHLQVNGNQELLQYFTRAMTEWTSGSSNKFCNDVVKDNHRGIWARRSILVQICFDWLRGPECHLQSTDRHYPMEINAWRKEGCVPISIIRVQGLGSSQLGTKRERQACASGN